MAIYTIGHSNISAEALAAVIGAVDVVMDIRSHPHSKWEQFWKENLEQWVPGAGMTYEWEPNLGGWTERHMYLADRMREYGVDLAAYSKGKFPKQRIGVKREEIMGGQELMWTNQGLWDYQFFMMLPEFMQAADDLIRRVAATGENIGIMCCEVLWWKCHRSMVSDYLIWRGAEATHFQPKITLHSNAIGNRLERYHPDVLRAWRDWASTRPLGDIELASI